MITLDEYLDRLCRLGVDRGPRGFPRKQRDRQILMKSILSMMDSGRVYREKDINELLKAWNEKVAPAIKSDYVTIRRLPVDWGHLERTADGASYRVGFPPSGVLFELEVDEETGRIRFEVCKAVVDLTANSDDEFADDQFG